MKQPGNKDPLRPIRGALDGRRGLCTHRRPALYGSAAALLCVVLAAAVCGAAEVLLGAGFELQGGVVATGSLASAGGEYRVEAVAATADDGAAEFSLASPTAGAAKSATGCPCQGDVIFSDGFESGNLNGWSATSP